MGEELARLVLLAIVGAYFVNLSRGTGGVWLRSKFFGQAGPPRSSSSSPSSRSPLLRGDSSPGGRGGV
jgi:hypothetical protein